MIDVALTEAEITALLALLGPYLTRHPGDATLRTAEQRLDVALLTHEENHIARQ